LGKGKGEVLEFSEIYRVDISWLGMVGESGNAGGDVFFWGIF